MYSKQKIRKKGAVADEFFFTLIVAIVIFVPTVMWATSWFRLTDRGLDNYNTLVDKIGLLKSGEADSMSLYLDTDTAILFFEPDAEYVSLLSDIKDISWSATGIRGYDYTYLAVERPSECENGMSCVCLCQEAPDSMVVNMNTKTFDPDVLITQNKDKIPTCTKSICSSYENEDFFTKTKSNFKGGFFIERGWSKAKVPKYRAFYLQRYRNVISVCDEPRCITSAEKTVYDDYWTAVNGFESALFTCSQKTDEDCVCGHFNNIYFTPNNEFRYDIVDTKKDDKSLVIETYSLGKPFKEKKLGWDICVYNVDIGTLEEPQKLFFSYVDKPIYSFIFSVSDSDVTVKQTLFVKKKGKTCIAQRDVKGSFYFDGDGGLIEIGAKQRKIPSCKK